MILRVEKIAREFDVVRAGMDARTQAHGRESFHLLHGQLDRFLMGPFQTRIKERHDRNRLLSRALEIVEADRVPDVPDRQFLSVDGIDVLLEGRENLLLNGLVRESEILRKRPAPDTFDRFVFGIIVVAGEMLTVKIRSFSSRRFDPGTGKHPTPFGFRCLPLLDGAGECKKCVFGSITAKTDLSTAKKKNSEVLPIMEDALTLSSAWDSLIIHNKAII